MRKQHRIDPTDARLLLALAGQPRATAIALTGQTGLSRNTVQARLARLEDQGVLDSFERQIPPVALVLVLTLATEIGEARFGVEKIDRSTGVSLPGLDTRTECIEERRDFSREEDSDFQASVQFQVSGREVRFDTPGDVDEARSARAGAADRMDGQTILADPNRTSDTRR